MIKFFVRFCIILVIMFMVAVLSMLINSAFAALIFLFCVWLSVRDLDEIFGWIFLASVIFALLHYDQFTAYVGLSVLAVFLFDYVKMQILRNYQKGRFFQYLITLGMTVIVVSAMEFFSDHSVKNVLSMLMRTITVVTVFYFPLYFLIERLERFADLYSRGLDVKCHT